jgi:hypothetical protein
MDKARKFGWNGHVESLDAIKEVFDRLVDFKMIPPLDGVK